MQSAELVVEIVQMCRDAGNLAVALEGSLGHDQRFAHRRAEIGKAALGRAALGKGEKLAFGQLDLVAAALPLFRRQGTRAQAGADVQELPAHGEIADDARIVGHLRPEGGAFQEVDEIGRAANRGELVGLLELLAQGHAIGHPALFDQAGTGGIDLLVSRGIEVLRPQNLGHALVCVIVEQYRTQHRGFCREIVGHIHTGVVMIFRHPPCLTKFELHFAA